MNTTNYREFRRGLYAALLEEKNLSIDPLTIKRAHELNKLLKLFFGAMEDDLESYKESHNITYEEVGQGCFHCVKNSSVGFLNKHGKLYPRLNKAAKAFPNVTIRKNGQVYSLIITDKE